MAVQSMLYQISVNCVSDIGLVRQNNEDALKIIKDEQFFVLADGMGGHQAGEVASNEAVNQLCSLFQSHLERFHLDLETASHCLKDIIQAVNAKIYQLGKKTPAYRGMGTTLCCLYFHIDGLICGHVGDSRIYRFRKGVLEQITQDHSLLRELIDLGQLSEQQAGDFLYKNIITKAIGTEPNVEPTIKCITVELDDVFLMCSDGLSDLVPINEMQTIVAEHSNEEAIQILVNTAKKNGGFDNISLILLRLETAVTDEVDIPVW